jgi:hypothetical protein
MLLLKQSFQIFRRIITERKDIGSAAAVRAVSVDVSCGAGNGGSCDSGNGGSCDSAVA